MSSVKTQWGSLSVASSSAGSSSTVVNGNKRAGAPTNSFYRHKRGRNSDQNVQISSGIHVTITLKTETQFLVASRFSEVMNDVNRRYSGFFDRDEKCWILPLAKYDDYIKALKATKLELQIDELPWFITRHVEDGRFKEPADLISRGNAEKQIKDTLPKCLYETLRPFQLRGIVRAVQRNGRVLIGDEMGLGKTIQALSIAYHYSTEWPLLIICPSSLRHTWAEELKRWLEIGDENIQIITSGKQRPSNLICIVSYDLAAKMPDVLKSFKIIIADESHYLKSQESKRTRAITPLIKNAQRALLLTGTPALSRPIELFTQLNALEPTLFSNPTAFGKRYCGGIEGAYGWDFTGSSNLAELHLLASSTVLIRRLKKDVLSELPPKNRQKVFVEPCVKHKKQLQSLMKQKSLLDDKIKQTSNNATKQGLMMQRKSLTVKM